VRSGTERLVDVAVVGGGIAGAAVATRLARSGCSVVVLERSPRWRWRACGVFSSPAALVELRALGMRSATLEAVARPIPAMRVETRRGTTFRLTYGAGADGSGGPVGFDRGTLDESVLELAVAAGADVRRACAVTSIELPRNGRPSTLAIRGPGGTVTLGARFVVGADGIRSVVARDAGVARPARLGTRVGITWHIPDAHGSEPRDARMVVLDGAYCGLAPVPRGRINVGIVLAGRRWLRALATDGATAVGEQILREVTAGEHGTNLARAVTRVDRVAGAAPLGHRVTKRAGPGWLLVGDAAGFLDPFTGEGLHRALASARLAAEVILAGPSLALDPLAYDRAMRERFGTKDVVSHLVQAFLARPSLFEYAAHRLAEREAARQTMSKVIGDLAPATDALDPRFVGRLLAP
jgi:flavin-dependent dehydrogenase